MSGKEEAMIELMENLPCRLDRFWRARVLKPHQLPDEFAENLKLSLCLHSEEEIEAVLGLLKERQLFDHFVDEN